MSEVDIIQSYLDLNNCPTFLDLKLVIHLEFLLIVNKSLDAANFASIKGNLYFLFKNNFYKNLYFLY